LLRLLLPLAYEHREGFTNGCLGQAPRQHPIVFIRWPSVATTGGVYKWQGRNPCSLMNCTYEAFLVHGR